MARLHSAPSRAAVIRPQTPPSIASHSSADTEAAANQLLAESTASASKSHVGPRSSAVFGANLLNAARVDYRHSSPVRPTRTAENGKLRRVTFCAERPRQHRARGEEIYDIPADSPEKRALSLPERINQIPLKVNKKPSAHGEPEPSSDLPDLRYSQHVHVETIQESPVPIHRLSEDAEESHVGSSPPRVVDEAEPDVDEGPTLQPPPRRARGRPRKHPPTNADEPHSTVSEPDDRPFLPKVQQRCGAAVQSQEGLRQCKVHSTKETANGPRCAKHSKKASFVPIVNGKPESAKEKANSGKVRTTAAPGTRAKRSADQDVPEEGSSSAAKKQRGAKGRSISKTSDADNASSPVATPPNVNSPKDSSRRTQTLDDDQEYVQAAEDQAEDEEEEIEEEEEEKIEEEETGTVGEKRVIDKAFDKAFESVFDYADCEERSGQCQTTRGKNIKRILDKFTSLLETEDLTIDAVAEHTRQVIKTLASIRQVKEARRFDFKSDAYNYVFRSIVLYLRALYDWHSEINEQLDESTDALRDLDSLVNEIVSWKDTIRSWKAKVPQRYQGDTFIQDVNTQVIKPLRKIGDAIKKKRCMLMAKEDMRKKREEMRRQIAEEEAEAERREAIEAEKREKWSRWQELHVKRMQCEPDLSKRRKLVITRLEHLEETDANGMRFERLPLFKDRTTPPAHWPASVVEKEWTNAQETALIEGLERFAGPKVYHKIFATYCCPGGPLRRFSVTDIVAKAAWVQASWQKLQQEKGWAIPSWVSRIPLLP